MALPSFVSSFNGALAVLKTQLSVLEAKHCPSSSDVRELIAKPPPPCQSEVLYKLFDENFHSKSLKCTCCYSCIVKHKNEGCGNCGAFLATFFTEKPHNKFARSVGLSLKEAMEELFTAIGTDVLLVENKFPIPVSSFVRDFLKMSDEIRREQDIVDMWHLDPAIAHSLFQLFSEVVFGGLDLENTSENIESVDSDSESDFLDQSTDED